MRRLSIAASGAYIVAIAICKNFYLWCISPIQTTTDHFQFRSLLWWSLKWGGGRLKHNQFNVQPSLFHLTMFNKRLSIPVFTLFMFIVRTSTRKKWNEWNIKQNRNVTLIYAESHNITIHIQYIIWNIYIYTEWCSVSERRRLELQQPLMRYLTLKVCSD